MWKPATFILGAISVLLLIAFTTSYFRVGAMTIQDGANLATILGNIAVAVSIFIIAAQLRQQAKQAAQQTQLARAANSQSLVTTSSDFVLQIGTDQELMKLWHGGGAVYDSKTEEEKAQYRYLVQWWLNFYENVHYQWTCHLLDKEVFDAWMKDMRGFVERRKVEKIWDLVKGNYSDQFVKYFQPIIDARRQALAAPAPAAPPRT